MNDKIELLSPAGDLVRLKAAVDYGADAVYFGGTEFGMRAAPQNFTIDDMRKGVEYAHSNGARAYLTLNTLPRNNELSRLPEFIKAAANTGVDAFIVTDLGAIEAVKKYAADCELHISVQTGIVNYGSANFYHSLGASRVVLARELSLDEITEIRAKTSDELCLEAFVHGAVCMSVSGRCLLSNYLTGRDSNRGDCAQPCRWCYSLVEEKRPGMYMPIVQDERGSYILNAQDMCMIRHIPQLYYAGIRSFKIEGRAKTEYYTAAVTSAYRKAINAFVQSGYDRDFVLDENIANEVNKISHRQYSESFYFGIPTSKNGQVYDNGGYIRDYELIGIVQDYQNGIATVSQRNRFYPGEYDVLDCKRGSYVIKVNELFDENMQPIEVANRAASTVKIRCEPLTAGSFIRQKKSAVSN